MYRTRFLRSLCGSSLLSSKQYFLQSNSYRGKFVRLTQCSYGNHANAIVDRSSHQRALYSVSSFLDTPIKILGSGSSDGVMCKTVPGAGFSPVPSRVFFQNKTLFLAATPLLRPHSSLLCFSTKADDSRASDNLAAPGAEVDVTNSGGSDWVGKVTDYAADTVAYTGEKAKHASDQLSFHIQHLLESQPYFKIIALPLGYTMIGTVLAWVVMPRILRRFHKYSMKTPAAVLSTGLARGHVPYEQSFWGALEDPIRYLVTFMAFTQIGGLVAPHTIASQYLVQAWRGAAIISFVWFLHRWKTNVLARSLTVQSLEGVDREKLMTLDKVSSVGLFVIGLMAIAEACGVAVQSILTVGGIGGVATAFAARDILGNVLSGLSMQFSKPFSLGDKIKAGSIEGQVVEMGLTATKLLNAQKFPVLVPNSLFSSQVIVNQSRAEWLAFVTKIPIHIEDLQPIPQISNDIKSMLRSNSKVFLGKEDPYCFLSHVESSHAQLTLGCDLKPMSKVELYTTQQDILLQSVQIINKYGARLGQIL